jgi:hypothetical protein
MGGCRAKTKLATEASRNMRSKFHVAGNVSEPSNKTGFENLTTFPLDIASYFPSFH